MEDDLLFSVKFDLYYFYFLSVLQIYFKYKKNKYNKRKITING